MTPLAMLLAKQLVSKPRDRVGIWQTDENVKLLREALNDIHCFEVSQSFPLLGELAKRLEQSQPDQAEAVFETYAFLPAPKTWIEWNRGSGDRYGVLLEEVGRKVTTRTLGFPKGVDALADAPWAQATWFCDEWASHLGYLSMTSADYYDGHPGSDEPRYFPDDLGGNPAVALLKTAHTMLLLINSPKIIGRRQVMPHRALEKQLTKAMGVGKFPLHAWTEIKLHVAKPIEIDDGEPHEAHLTGRRALHFVRKHIRIRLGRLEYVTSHWRGDPAVGIKQSRYVVAA